MKLKRVFVFVAAFLNLYMFVAWTYAWNNYAIHPIRVKAFREFFGGLKVGSINIAIVGLTVLSLILISAIKPKWLRLSLIILHSLTLLLILWSIL